MNQQSEDLRHRAADPYYFAAYLPYFSVKPLYVLALQAAHRLGASVTDSSRLISASFYFCISVIAWSYTRSLLSAIVMIIPEVIVLGQANEPDGMSAFLLLLGLWLLFVKETDWGIVPIVISVWVRPENAIACAVILAFLYFGGRINAKFAIAFLGIAVASAAFIDHYGYGARSLYFHTFLGGAPTGSPHFGATDFMRALASGLKDLGHTSLPTFALLWLLCFSLLKGGVRKILGIALLFSALRFVIFPSYEARYYALFFLTTALSAVLLIRTSLLNRRMPPSVLANSVS